MLQLRNVSAQLQLGAEGQLLLQRPCAASAAAPHTHAAVARAAEQQRAEVRQLLDCQAGDRPFGLLRVEAAALIPGVVGSQFRVLSFSIHNCAEQLNESHLKPHRKLPRL